MSENLKKKTVYFQDKNLYNPYNLKKIHTIRTFWPPCMYSLNQTSSLPKPTKQSKHKQKHKNYKPLEKQTTPTITKKTHKNKHNFQKHLKPLKTFKTLNTLKTTKNNTKIYMIHQNKLTNSYKNKQTPDKHKHTFQKTNITHRFKNLRKPTKP